MSGLSCLSKDSRIVHQAPSGFLCSCFGKRFSLSPGPMNFGVGLKLAQQGFPYCQPPPSTATLLRSSAHLAGNLFHTESLSKATLLRSSAHLAGTLFHTESPYHNQITALIRAKGQAPISYRIPLPQPHYCCHPRTRQAPHFIQNPPSTATLLRTSAPRDRHPIS